MKRIWAMWHMMVEPFDEVASYSGGFRWEAILHNVANITRDPKQLGQTFGSFTS
ncbi:hypothetical protein Hanom_Chr07g00606051 [Helianthus anomalus]